ncbi:hypothetical protein ACIHCM_09840 [Streptomyces sp. NPDC052023]|uniref:hypothetical protein n=1 Tax=Streptomyces sp. NPDC052023 TaxID=3365681 RepID=UPI0037D45231
MDEMPQRIAPSTDRTAAARLLGCAPHDVGYCPRCQGLTHRYGRHAQIICPACRAAQAPPGEPPASTSTASAQPPNSPRR